MFELTQGEALILAIGALGLGIVLLVRGGNWTIDAAVYTARHVGVSPLVVGFTIVAFGTSLPELIVSVNANLKGSAGIALGNVIGSNIANVLLVIGATSVVATLQAVPRDLMRDLTVMMLSTLVFMGLILSGEVSRIAGFSMIAFLLGYVAWQYRMALKGEIVVEEVEEPEFSSLRNSIIFLLIGLACIAIGAEFLVRGAQVSAGILGVPEAVIGLSVIAIGTSLPELSTCLIAAAKRHSDIVLGNIIGSNVFNILMIIGVTAAVRPIGEAAIDAQLVKFDIWVFFGISLIFTALLLAYRKINRPIGIVMLIGYVAYIGTIYALYLMSGADIIVAQ